MPGTLLHIGTNGQCSHLAKISLSPSQTSVQVSGQAVAVAPGPGTVSACPFTLPNGKSQPCVTVEPMKATKVLIKGQAPYISSAGAMCKTAEQLTQGTATFVPQARVTVI